MRGKKKTQGGDEQMKMVTLLGSPRSKGNSATMANLIIDTAAELGAQNRTFELNRLTYRGCQACYACKSVADACIMKDDLTEVLKAVEEAELVVLASPVYYGEVSSQLKGYIDRTFSFLVPDYITSAYPSRLKPKKLIFVLAQGHPDDTLFADIFPRYQNFLKWQGFTDIRLVRACGVGPGRQDRVPEEVLHYAEAMVRQMMA
jgi:multimeric flavodoxin WrbA